MTTKTRTIETRKYARPLKMVNAMFYCPKLEKNVSVRSEELEWDFGEDDCELCGSHGHLAVEFKCKCGGTHRVELRDW